LHGNFCRIFTRTIEIMAIFSMKKDMRMKNMRKMKVMGVEHEQ
jgi:hypothetical protein